jgi:hypothetical protein
MSKFMSSPGPTTVGAPVGCAVATSSAPKMRPGKAGHRSTSGNDTSKLGLRPGELVRVRSAREIFSTLDEKGTLDGLPFMPEMVKFCGRTLPVAQRADKTCNMNETGSGMDRRRMHETVHLANVRCDGGAHGGCQAACLMFWKEAWLERVGSDAAAKVPDLNDDERAFIDETLVPGTVDEAESSDGETVYRCQATEVDNASTLIREWHLGQYVRDLRSWPLSKIVRGLAREVFNLFQRFCRKLMPPFLRYRGGLTAPFLQGELEEGKTPKGTLDLQPGDMVRIKSKEEIVKTLDRAKRNRGLSFDTEMVPYCGRTARVRGRINRIIHEHTGKMIEIKSDSIILEGVVCKADYHRFCTRATYPYWREIWLEKLD